MSGAMLHGLGDCTPELNCGCITADQRAYSTFTSAEGVRRSRADMNSEEVEATYGSARAIGSHHSHRAGTTSWLTPPHIIEALGPFDTDPCAFAGWPTAAAHITLPTDGLAEPWDGFVWLNPPYGSDTWRWLAKLAEHGTGIALIFARTETAGFVEEVWGKADAVLFLHGRLHFHHADGTRAAANSGAPSCLVAYGTDAVRRLNLSRLPGSLVTEWGNQ